MRIITDGYSIETDPSKFLTQLFRITEEISEILKNKEITAINQDPLIGTSITPEMDWSALEITSIYLRRLRFLISRIARSIVPTLLNTGAERFNMESFFHPTWCVINLILVLTNSVRYFVCHARLSR